MDPGDAEYAPSISRHRILIFHQSPRVTFAHDNLSRIVVIKAVPPSKTSQLEILSFLNSPQLRASPENHTIPFIELVHSDEGLAFYCHARLDVDHGPLPKDMASRKSTITLQLLFSL